MAADYPGSISALVRADLDGSDYNYRNVGAILTRLTQQAGSFRVTLDRALAPDERSIIVDASDGVETFLYDISPTTFIVVCAVSGVATDPEYLSVSVYDLGGLTLNVALDDSITVPPVPPSVGGTPSGPAGGDLGGTYPNPTLAGIQGDGLSVTAPVEGDVLAFNGTFWANGVPAPMLQRGVRGFTSGAFYEGSNTSYRISTAAGFLVGLLFRPSLLNGSNQYVIGTRDATQDGFQITVSGAAGGPLDLSATVTDDGGGATDLTITRQIDMPASATVGGGANLNRLLLVHLAAYFDGGSTPALALFLNGSQAGPAELSASGGASFIASTDPFRVGLRGVGTEAEGCDVLGFGIARSVEFGVDYFPLDLAVHFDDVYNAQQFTDFPGNLFDEFHRSEELGALASAPATWAAAAGAPASDLTLNGSLNNIGTIPAVF